MHIELMTSETAFEQLRPAWLALWQKATARVPFLHPDYLRVWWHHRGGGEWPPTATLLLAAAYEAENLIGLAPLFCAPNRDGRAALLLLGSIEISDYLDWLVLPTHTDAFCAALLERLAQPDVPAWEVIDLYNIPASSPTRAALARVATAQGWTVTETPLQQVPVIALPATFDDYLGMMDKKERQELKRKLRRAEGGDTPMEWQIVPPTADIAAEAEAFMALMALNADKARFLSPAMRAQFAGAVQAMAANNLLHLAFATVNGERAAGYLSFTDGKRLYVYNSAIDPRFGALSAGWVLLGWLIQWCIENKYAAFDFMRGDEDYKFRFGATATKIYRLQLSRTLKAEDLGGVSGSVTNAEERAVFPAEQAPRPHRDY